MALTRGTRIGPYEIVAPIGRGGMGEVYRAHDAALGRDVAIKILPESFAGDPERMARFEREARVLASLNHPHIASIYGAGSDGGVRFLAMELVEGEELAAQILRGGLPVAEAITIARQMAAALEVAHEKAIIHRDLKPANVKLTADGAVKLLDFGLAKAFEGDSGAEGDPASAFSATMISPMTAANVILGTAAYMSPEQARGKSVDRRADIWAFGCVLYECLTGRRAFGGETVSDTVAKVLERDPDFTVLPRDTPPRVRELLERCLVKDPKLRLRDIGDARIVLDEVLATRAPSGSFAAPTAPKSAQAQRRLPLPALAVALLAGAALGAGLWRAFAPHAPARETRCVAVTMPPGTVAQNVFLTRDGRTLLVSGRLKDAQGSTENALRLYARDLDRFEFTELTAAKGLVGCGWAPNPRHVGVLTPLTPGSPQLRFAHMPVDGSAPPTAITEWKDSWQTITMLGSGDLLFQEGLAAFVRVPADGGPASAAVKIDAGRPGVARYELMSVTLPGDRAVFVNVVSYDARGWHYSVGVMELSTGKVKVLIEDGGQPVYSPTGHLVFTRGDAVLAVPFDLGRLEVRGTPAAVWSGLSTPYSFFPANFQLTSDGSLFYRPGSGGGERELSLIDATGHVAPWLSEKRALNGTLEPSPDGRRVACQIPSGRGIDEIWISEIDRPGLQRLGTDPNADCASPRWSPDGKRIVYFRSGGDDRDGLYVQNADGGPAVRLFKRESPNVDYSGAAWIPGGSALLLSRQVSGVGQLALLQLAGAEADTTRLRVLTPGTSRQFAPRLSPDGRLLTFASDESGRVLAYVAALHPDGSLGRPIAVKTSGIVVYRWSADGRALLVEDNRHRLMSASVTVEPELSVSEPVEVQDFERLHVAASWWAPLPGNRLLVALKNDNDGDPSSYNLVLNWTAELQRRMQGR